MLLAFGRGAVRAMPIAFACWDVGFLHSLTAAAAGRELAAFMAR